MPTGKNWMNFIYVNTIFIAQIFGIYYFVALKKLHDNWPVYRCNPMFMPFSKNIQQQNFLFSSHWNLVGFGDGFLLVCACLRVGLLIREEPESIW